MVSPTLASYRYVANHYIYLYTMNAPFNYKIKVITHHSVTYVTIAMHQLCCSETGKNYDFRLGVVANDFPLVSCANLPSLSS